MELYGKKVILRAVEEEDLEMLRELSNSPDFEKMIVGWSFPISKKDQLEWFANCKNSLSVIRYTIETEEDGAVGMIVIPIMEIPCFCIKTTFTVMTTS